MLVIVDVRPDVEGLPVAAYQTVETVVTGAATGAAPTSPTAAASAAGDVATLRTFAHVTSEVGAHEAEEVRALPSHQLVEGESAGIPASASSRPHPYLTPSPLSHHLLLSPCSSPLQVGVEQLLRDINDPSVSSMAGEAVHKLGGLRGLVARLGDISAYLGAVLDGKLPQNNEIMYSVQAVLASLPNMNVEALSGALTEATNDQHLALYVASLTRSVLALHDLVANKAAYKDVEEGALSGSSAAADKKEGDEAGKKDEKKDAGSKAKGK